MILKRNFTESKTLSFQSIFLSRSFLEHFQNRIGDHPKITEKLTEEIINDHLNIRLRHVTEDEHRG